MQDNKNKTNNNKLKEYIDSLLGYNVYDLFSEIKDNL